MNEKQLIPLGELVRSTKKRNLNPKDFPNEIFELFSIPSFDKGYPEIIKGVEIGSTKQLVEPGDTLLSKIVPHIRRSWVVSDKKGPRQIASGEWLVFKNEKADGKYLSYYLTSDRFHAAFMNTVAGVGGSLNRARPEHVYKILVPLPPLDEQRRIAKILNLVSGLINKAKKRLLVTSEIDASYFNQVFGDPISNEKKWDMGTLNFFIDSFETGKSLKPSSNKDSNGPKILKVSSVSSGKYLPSEAKVLPSTSTIDPKWWVQNGDLLFCRANTRELVGSLAEVFNQKEERVLPDKIWRFVFADKNKNMNQFFISLFRHPSFRRELIKRASGTSGSMLNISKSSVLNLKTITPPIKLIDQYCQTIKLINPQIQALDNSLNHLSELGKSLQINLLKEAI